VLVPHVASATNWTREGMATLAACNVAAVLTGQEWGTGVSTSDFLMDGPPPRHAPSILNGPQLQNGLSA